MIDWKRITTSQPPFNKHVLAINENGFIVQTRRFKAWNAHWIGSEDGRDIKRWQYWAELPNVPENIKKSYD